MSSGAHSVLDRFHWPRRWLVWLVGLAAIAGLGLVIDDLLRVRRGTRGRQSHAWWGGSTPAVAHSLSRRKGEAKRTHDRDPVIVLPAYLEPARSDAVAYLAGGPGGAATDNAVGRQYS